MAKTCTKCLEIKESSEFYPRGDKKGCGLRSHCKLCVTSKVKEDYDPIKKKEYNAKYYEITQESQREHSKKFYQMKGKANRLKAEYGITLDDYIKMHEDQHGVCAICKQPERVKNRVLTVDHCHKTGKVRGLLCFDCNTALGKFKDNTELLETAIGYLGGSYR